MSSVITTSQQFSRLQLSIYSYSRTRDFTLLKCVRQQYYCKQSHTLLVANGHH